MNLLSNLGVPPALFFLFFVWSLFWKGLALWHAAGKNKQRNWFIVLLVANTLGVLDILYLFVFSTKKFSLQQLRNF